MNLLTKTQGLLVPNLSDKDRLDLTPVNWILIVEKEVKSTCSRQIDAKVL